MSKRTLFTIIFFIFISSNVSAQWLVVYYAFELKDADGNYIDSLNKNYEMKTVKWEPTSEALLDVKICADNRTWRFEEGYRDFDKINKLEITKTDGAHETMVIEFLPAFNEGKKHYYNNLYLGSLNFKEGTYRIKLPQSGDEWDSLKEIILCPEISYEFGGYLDISELQK